MFAPGIISTAANQHGFPAFSPDGREVFWSNYNDAGDFQTIYYMQQDDEGFWTPPDVAWFSGEIAEGNVAFSHAGDKIFFSSDALLNERGEVDPKADIWVMERVAEGWSSRRNVGPPLNTEMMEFFPYLTRDGTMYLQGTLGDGAEGSPTGGPSSFGIFSAEFEHGRYQNKVPLNRGINTRYRDQTPAVDPAETFLIFSSNRPGGEGSGDLYISFKTSAGDWGPPTNMGPDINTSDMERFPGLSPDGAYLFFVRGFGDIYWLSTDVIEGLRSH